MITEIFSDADSAVKKMTEDIKKSLEAFKSSGREGKYNLVLAGGSTAKKTFDHWVKNPGEAPDWNLINFYWVDERCVAETSPQSHFGIAKTHLFDPLGISEDSYFRMFGESEPVMESIRYESLVKKNVPSAGSLNIPRFDGIILGVSADYHTASLFTNNLTLLTDKRIVAVSSHPVTKAVRITMTGTLILNAKNIFVPIFGLQKREMVKSLVSKRAPDHLPAPYILNRARNAVIYTDCLD